MVLSVYRPDVEGLVIYAQTAPVGVARPWTQQDGIASQEHVLGAVQALGRVYHRMNPSVYVSDAFFASAAGNNDGTEFHQSLVQEARRRGFRSNDGVDSVIIAFGRPLEKQLGEVVHSLLGNMSLVSFSPAEAAHKNL